MNPITPNLPEGTQGSGFWGNIDRLLRTRRGKQVIVSLVLITFLVLGISYLNKTRKGRSALIRWMPQVAELQEGKNIFLDPPEGYTFPHPPFAAINLYPYPSLPNQVAAALWFLLRTAAFLFSLWMIFSIVSERGSPFTPLAMVFVFILCLRTAESDLQHGNINLLILFWCTLAFWAFKKEKDVLAGIALAVGISLKITPALILVYFLYKRAWKTCSWGIVGLILCNIIIPMLFFGPAKTWEYSFSWYKGMVEPHMIQGKIDESFINQSIQGVMVRFLSEPSGRNLENLDYAFSVFSLSHEQARLIIRGVMLTLIGILAFTCRAKTKSKDNFFLAVEYSIVLLTMLYFNERSWKHHFVLAAFPYAIWVYILQRNWESTKHFISTKIWLGFLILSGAMVLFSSEDALGAIMTVATFNRELGDRLGEIISDHFEFYGGMFFSSFILYVGLIYLAWKSQRENLPNLNQALKPEKT